MCDESQCSYLSPADALGVPSAPDVDERGSVAFERISLFCRFWVFLRVRWMTLLPYVLPLHTRFTALSNPLP